jgi:hypothetical protein
MPLSVGRFLRISSTDLAGPPNGSGHSEGKSQGTGMDSPAGLEMFV